MRFTLCALLIALFPMSAVAQSPAAPRMIDSNGHKVAFHVTPGHLPVIVLDAGSGLDSSYWDSLVPELAKRTGCKIITYDRVGYGASDEVAEPWNVQHATDDLENGLKALDATHDLILVPHSMAGEIAAYLASRHPDWISGAVLVDASVPDLYTDAFIAALAEKIEPTAAELKAIPSTKETRQTLNVFASFVETSRAFHKASWPKSVPATVIVAEHAPAPEVTQMWREGHANFAEAAPNRKMVIAGRSSHDIAHDRPDVIVDAIAKMAVETRKHH